MGIRFRRKESNVDVGIRIVLPMLGVMISMICMSGCSNTASTSNNEILDKTIESIIESVRTYNYDEFCSLLSENILELNDTNAGFEYMHNVLKGEIIEISSNGSGSDEAFLPQGYGKTLLGSYDIATSVDKYELDFEQVLSDGDGRESEGIVFIKLFRKGDIDTEGKRRSSNTYNRIGIFNPEWNELNEHLKGAN